MSSLDPKRVVAEGYDRIAEGLLGRRRETPPSGRKLAYLERLTGRLADGAWVLDLGCGPGEQAAWLSTRLRVAAVDISRAQLALARSEAPDAALVLADMCSLPFKLGAFDAIAAIYSIIHVPREAHEPLLRHLYELLRPGCRLLAVLGAHAWEGTEEDWLGLGAEMYWSHYGREENIEMIERAGFRIEGAKVEADELTGSGAHLFVLADKPV